MGEITDKASIKYGLLPLRARGQLVLGCKLENIKILPAARVGHNTPAAATDAGALSNALVGALSNALPFIV